jgi:hypothetical protein
MCPVPFLPSATQLHAAALAQPLEKQVLAGTAGRARDGQAPPTARAGAGDMGGGVQPRRLGQRRMTHLHHVKKQAPLVLNAKRRRRASPETRDTLRPAERARWWSVLRLVSAKHACMS